MKNKSNSNQRQSATVAMQQLGLFPYFVATPKEPWQVQIPSWGQCYKQFMQGTRTTETIYACLLRKKCMGMHTITLIRCHGQNVANRKKNVLVFNTRGGFVHTTKLPHSSL